MHCSRYTLYSVGEVIYEQRIAHVNFRSNYLLFTVVARIVALYFFGGDFRMRKNCPHDFHSFARLVEKKSVFIVKRTVIQTVIAE